MEMKKIKNKLSETFRSKSFWKGVGKIALIIGIVAVIAVSSYFILRACGFTTKEDFEKLRDKLGDSLAFWAIIVALQIFQSVCLPISNSLISLPVSMIFKDEIWKVFLASWIGITIGNIILYYIGRFSGGKLLKFVVGDEEKAEKFKGFMQDGKSFYLIAGVTPLIPSDICNVLAGVCGYNALFVIIATIITRGICVATTCWFGGLVTTYPWLIAVLVVVIIGMLVIATFITKRLLKKRKENVFTTTSQETE